MSSSKVVGTIPETQPLPSEQAVQKVVSDKPTKPLPTDRVGFQKQLELLRGYAALTSQGKKIVTNPEVAELAKIHSNTSNLAHPFFVDVGFLKRDGAGYIVAPEVLAYGKALNWNAETAPHKLGPLLRQTWFANALLPRLAMGPGLPERQAVDVLADASGAGRKYESQLKPILSYLVISGLIRRDGDTYRQGIPVQEEAAVATDPATRADVEDEPRAIRREREPIRGTSMATAFSQAPEGVLRFNVDVSVDLKDFATWEPERITAFWAGIAAVLRAKADVERDGRG